MKTSTRIPLDGGCTHSYFGVVNTLTEAHLLLEAARVGIVPRVSRRLSDAEKVKYVKPGAVFLFEEEESGILRWTDHFRWSASRVSGSFLLYTAIELPSSNNADDTLIKQSFFSVDAAGARMHLIAYSSRRYRLGEGAHRSVSEDRSICDRVTVAKSLTPLPLRPRVVSTSHCFALVRTAPAVSTPITFNSGSTYTQSSFTLPPTVSRVGTSSQTYQHTSIKKNRIESTPAFLPLVPHSHIHLPTTTSSSNARPPTFSSPTTLPFFTDVNQIISRSSFSSLPSSSSSTPTTSSAASTSSRSSRSSRSITPTTPILRPLSPPSSPKRGSIPSITTIIGSSRYQPYYPDSSRIRLASVPTLYKSTSFDSALSGIQRSKTDFTYPKEIFIVGDREVFSTVRSAEDMRVLSLLGKISTQL